MEAISFSEAKAHLSEIMDRVESGDQVTISRHGKPIARIIPIEQPRKPLDIEAMRAHLRSMGGPVDDSEAFWRAFRAADRY